MDFERKNSRSDITIWFLSKNDILKLNSFTKVATNFTRFSIYK